ncbi:MAG: hypothetical protein K2O17_06880 [Bacteroidaceae bacterium]|nr:hypothetical protein [Bacteroidaceae bacterium]
MTTLAKVLSIADKVSIALFVWSFALLRYTRGDTVSPIVLSVVSLLFLIYLFKNSKNKPWGSKIMDCFVIVMFVLGFVEAEDLSLEEPSLIVVGVVTVLAALIDLFYYLYLEYYDFKQNKADITSEKSE